MIGFHSQKISLLLALIEWMTVSTATTTTCKKIEGQRCSGYYLDLIVDEFDEHTAESCEKLCLDEEECKYFKINHRGSHKSVCELLRVVVND